MQHKEELETCSANNDIIPLCTLRSTPEIKWNVHDAQKFITHTQESHRKDPDNKIATTTKRINGSRRNEQQDFCANPSRQ